MSHHPAYAFGGWSSHRRESPAVHANEALEVLQIAAPSGFAARICAKVTGSRLGQLKGLELC